MQRIPPETLVKFEGDEGRTHSGKVDSCEVRSGQRIYKVKVFPSNDMVEVVEEKIQVVGKS